MLIIRSYIVIKLSYLYYKSPRHETPYKNMVRFDYENSEIIHDRKRFSLRDFKLFMLTHHEDICMGRRIKGWIFDWESILFHARKYYIINFYLNNLKNSKLYETKKKT